MKKQRFLFVFFISLFILSLSSFSASAENASDGRIPITRKTEKESCLGRRVGAVKKRYTEAGFTNLEFIKEETDIASDDYLVFDLSINGDDSFQSGDTYDQDAAVVIRYWVYAAPEEAEAGQDVPDEKDSGESADRLTGSWTLNGGSLWGNTDLALSGSLEIWKDSFTIRLEDRIFMQGSWEPDNESSDSENKELSHYRFYTDDSTGYPVTVSFPDSASDETLSILLSDESSLSFSGHASAQSASDVAAGPDTAGQSAFGENASNKTQSGKEAPKDSAKAVYSAAKAAEAAGYYKIAENLYREVPKSKKAKEKYDSLHDTLARYSGVYTGESSACPGKSLFLIIYDGLVLPSFAGKSFSVQYELYRNENAIAFGSPMTEAYKKDDRLGYSSGYRMENAGDQILVSSVNEGDPQIWCGTYKRTSGLTDANRENLENWVEENRSASKTSSDAVLQMSNDQYMTRRLEAKALFTDLSGIASEFASLISSLYADPDSAEKYSSEQNGMRLVDFSGWEEYQALYKKAADIFGTFEEYEDTGCYIELRNYIDLCKHLGMLLKAAFQNIEKTAGTDGLTDQIPQYLEDFAAFIEVDTAAADFYASEMDEKYGKGRVR